MSLAQYFLKDQSAITNVGLRLRGRRANVNKAAAGALEVKIARANAPAVAHQEDDTTGSWTQRKVITAGVKLTFSPRWKSSVP
jgi:hypothetical protein